jgi:hypothetical protein
MQKSSKLRPLNKRKRLIDCSANLLFLADVIPVREPVDDLHATLPALVSEPVPAECNSHA